jgi:hypothetical protein
MIYKQGSADSQMKNEVPGPPKPVSRLPVTAVDIGGAVLPTGPLPVPSCPPYWEAAVFTEEDVSPKPSSSGNWAAASIDENPVSLTCLELALRLKALTVSSMSVGPCLDCCIVKSIRGPDSGTLCIGTGLCNHCEWIEESTFGIWRTEWAIS